MLAQPFPVSDYVAILPLTIVAVTPLLILLLDLILPTGAPRRDSAVAVGIAGLLLAAYVLVRQYLAHQFAPAFGFGFILGGFSIAFSLIVVASAIFSLLMVLPQRDDEKVGPSCALMLWSAAGAMLMAGAGDLMTIFLGLEILSLALYCLCGMVSKASDVRRREARESALKYLILSSMASGFMLYGMALLFGATGSVNLAALQAVPAGNPIFAMGCGLFMIGVAFKLGLVPFHVWMPDVFEGAPLPVTAFMSVVTKAGMLAVFARFLYGVLTPAGHEALIAPIWIVAGLSMLIGNLAALSQIDMKRLLAYSGIAQLGYIVAALAGTSTLGMRYAIFYLGAYTFMNLGAFAVVALISRDQEEDSHLSAFSGLGTRHPILAGAMAFFLLSLAGLPPTAGFIGKILILGSIIAASTIEGRASYQILAWLLIGGTAISIYVYIKIVRAMYVPVDLAHIREIRPLSYAPWIGVAICAVATVALGFYPVALHDVLPRIR
ncbi:MAG: NADH-quinone oxidoreductase subunit N [Candidatus Eremiobacteraeota bacterium]|nr:NADH-quinone oxidoreductase subunit N [Candidatus Eremiobacteraeota bacterium]